MSSLTQDVVDRLRNRIVGGELGPGDKLPAESALMEQFSVSRTVIREALYRLQAAGLVETYRGKGSYVLTARADDSFGAGPEDVSTREDRIQLLDFRLGIEVAAAGLAALHRSPVQLRKIASSLSDFRAARDKPSSAVEADFQFHRHISVATGNRFYAQLLGSLGPSMIVMPQTRLRVQENEQAAHFERVVVEHETVYAAIERQDGPAASAAMHTHLASSRARMEQAIN